MKELIKNKKVMMALLAILVLVAVIIVVRRRKNKDDDSDGGSAGGSSSGSGSLPLATFPLRPYSQAGEYSADKGSYGQQIANLQKICSQKFGYKLQVDGKWGDKSTEAFHKCLGTILFSDNISEQQYNLFIKQHGSGIVF
ncbi:MAG: hypothetical protein IJZ06_08030 [Bacteroidales bacterium]|nr:hypothetical protein [Bacteroidales bacterium]